jgi:hypothetical protein
VHALPDPRCFATSTLDPYDKLSTQVVEVADATQRQALLKELHGELQQALIAGRDDLLSELAAEVTSPATGRILWEAIDRAINSPSDPSGGLAARVFVLPVVFVTGGLAEAIVPGILPDAKAIEQTLEAHGALGPARSFGINKVLSGESSLEGFSPSRLYRLLRNLEAGIVDTWSELVPAEIDLESAEESIHLRFVAGVVVTPAQAPSFLETAGDIGRWGMPFSRALIAQLAQPGLSVLPLPRPPKGPLQALHEGHHAREEVAFQAFASRALRQLRSETGEPRITVAALESDAIGVRIVSSVDDRRIETHRWELDALDDLDTVSASISSLLADARVHDIRVLASVVSDAAFAAGQEPAAPH